MANLKVNVDLIKVYKKLGTENLRAGQMELANQALSDMNNYVPFKDGDLRKMVSMNMDASAIHYRAKYARRHFYAPKGSKGWKYTTAGTGPRWDKKAQRIHGKDWKKAFVEGAKLK